MWNGTTTSPNGLILGSTVIFLASTNPVPTSLYACSQIYTLTSKNAKVAECSPTVFISMVESVGTTLRGTAGLGERAGELGSHELRSSKENFSCKSNVAVDSNRGDWVSGHLGSTRLNHQHGGQDSTLLSDPSPDELEHT